MARDLILPAEGPGTGPVENASAVAVPVAVAAVVGIGVEAGIPVVAVESALGRVLRGRDDRRLPVLVAQLLSVVLDETVGVQQGAADADTPTDKIKKENEIMENRN